MSFSRATAFCVSELVGSGEDRISVMSRSARKFVKKLIQPFRRSSSRHASRMADGS
jgi:phosphopantothenoylcysteine synthetase/decarboxylase